MLNVAVIPRSNDITTSNTLGETMRAVVVSMFSVNIVLKLTMAASASFLWSMVHSIQLIQFLLFIDIPLPPNLYVLISYLEVATGNIEEFKMLLPSVVMDIFIDEQELERGAEFSRTQYFSKGLKSQFFVVNFQDLFTVIVAILLLMPLFWCVARRPSVQKRGCPRRFFGALHFNFQLRMFLEMYIELSFLSFVNLLAVDISSSQKFFATAILAFCLFCVILLPTALLHLTQINYRAIRKPMFVSRFGTITEDVRTDCPYRISYYPVFLFQRFLTSTTIVVFYSYPILTCVLVIVV